MTLDESVHGMRLRVIERAQALGNVSAVCREMGISRTVFYRWRKRLERYGVDGVHPRRQRGRPGRPVATPPEVGIGRDWVATERGIYRRIRTGSRSSAFRAPRARPPLPSAMRTRYLPDRPVDERS